jgi:hypothetical protein
MGLVTTLALLLGADLRGVQKRLLECSIELWPAFARAAVIADVAAGPRPQAAQLPSMALEMLGVGMASGHHRRRKHPVKVAEIPDCGVAVWRRLSDRPLRALALPIPGQKLVNALSGVILQAGEEVSEPGMRIDVVDPGRVDQGVDGGGAPATFIGASKGPIVATHGNWPDLPLGGMMDMHSRPSSRKRVRATHRVRQ